jgi:hypothetical protein
LPHPPQTQSHRAAHARLISLADAQDLPVWQGGLAHLAKDHRWYELIDETVPGFDCRALVISDEEGTALAVQPVFTVKQDLVAAAPILLRKLAAAARTVSPGFLQLKMLMVGNAAGEGHLVHYSGEEQRVMVAAAAPAVRELAQTCGASVIVWKDFPAEYRQTLAPLTRGEFVRIPSMPATRLPLDFSSFTDYMRRHLSRSMRKNLRRKFRATARLPLTMSVVTDVADCADELVPLYEQVRARARLRFERLTREFFAELGARMGDRVRFFLWRLDGRLVAFSLCLVHEGMICDEYLGLDYSVALDLHLYFVTYRDIISWAIEQGLKTYYSTPLNYDPKLHLGLELAPLDLYVAHANDTINRFFPAALRHLQPMKSEPLLARFPNAAELHA